MFSEAWDVDSRQTFSLQLQSLDTISPKTHGGVRLDSAQFILLRPWLQYCHSNRPICIFLTYSVIVTTFHTAGGFSSGLDSAPAPIHRHRAPHVQSLLGRLHEDGQPAVGHLSLFHGAHQLQREQQRTRYRESTSSRKVKLSDWDDPFPQVEIIIWRKTLRQGGGCTAFLDPSLVFRFLI